MPAILQILLVLAVLGFGLWLFGRYVAPKIASPFIELIYFIVAVCIIWGLLEAFEIVHTGVWRRLWRH